MNAAGAATIESQAMNPQKKFHLVFSLIMGAMKAFAIAYVVGVPVIFFLAPVARKLTGGLLGMPQ
jgi:hypothetical protein